MKSPIIDWGVAVRAIAGSDRPGDAYAVKTLGDRVLVAVIDGLGHGEPAAEASNLAVDVLSAHASEELVPLTRRCHEALRRTRGVVLSLASFDFRTDSMTWLGIGNVEGTLKRIDPAAKPSHESLFLNGGVVGYNLRTVRASVLPVTCGDTLVFATDGIRSGFAAEVRPDSSPQDTADRIIVNYSKNTDDALVLVVRYLGLNG